MHSNLVPGCVVMRPGIEASLTSDQKGSENDFSKPITQYNCIVKHTIFHSTLILRARTLMILAVYTQCSDTDPCIT